MGIASQDAEMGGINRHYKFDTEVEPAILRVEWVKDKTNEAEMLEILQPVRSICLAQCI